VTEDVLNEVKSEKTVEFVAEGLSRGFLVIPLKTRWSLSCESLSQFRIRRYAA